eukprot:11185201-Lingulodinium_polyedra.AAC.1
MRRAGRCAYQRPLDKTRLPHARAPRTRQTGRCNSDPRQTGNRLRNGPHNRSSEWERTPRGGRCA